MSKLQKVQTMLGTEIDFTYVQLLTSSNDQATVAATQWVVVHRILHAVAC